MFLIPWGILTLFSFSSSFVFCLFFPPSFFSEIERIKNLMPSADCYCCYSLTGLLVPWWVEVVSKVALWWAFHFIFRAVVFGWALKLTSHTRLGTKISRFGDQSSMSERVGQNWFCNTSNWQEMTSHPASSRTRLPIQKQASIIPLFTVWGCLQYNSWVMRRTSKGKFRVWISGNTLGKLQACFSIFKKQKKKKKKGHVQATK